jgi:hypothetical protein
MQVATVITAGALRARRGRRRKDKGRFRRASAKGKGERAADCAD